MWKTQRKQYENREFVIMAPSKVFVTSTKETSRKEAAGWKIVKKKHKNPTLLFVSNQQTA